MKIVLILLMSTMFGIQSYGGNPYGNYGCRSIKKPIFKFQIPNRTERGSKQVKGIITKI